MFKARSFALLIPTVNSAARIPIIDMVVSSSMSVKADPAQWETIDHSFLTAPLEPVSKFKKYLPQATFELLALDSPQSWFTLDR
jgi:hypothetical protein